MSTELLAVIPLAIATLIAFVVVFIKLADLAEQVMQIVTYNLQVRDAQREKNYEIHQKIKLLMDALDLEEESIKPRRRLIKKKKINQKTDASAFVESI